MQTNNNHFDNYNLDLYYSDINNNGIEDTWNNICNYILTNDDSIISNEIFCLDNLGELYEIGLEVSNKNLKKSRGKYFTPADVANLMSEFLIHYYFNLSDYEKIEYNICDVACGTGNLILAVLKNIGEVEVINLLTNNKIYLYDNDKIALKICETIILTKYKKYKNSIKLNIICNDFLDRKINLPNNSLVISNPPYAKIDNIPTNWKQTSIMLESMDLYVAFMEKIISQSKYSVIISPFSFISGSKFKKLRNLLNNYTGKIFSFDNVPGNIFNGRKKGIFNSNYTNSVRAAISIISSENSKGVQISPLIRFKNTEREQLLNVFTLNKFLPNTFQKINKQNENFYKCFKELEFIFNVLKNKTNNFEYNLNTLLTEKTDSKYKLFIPNTCRYYTVASFKQLNRQGQYILNFKDENSLNFAFCLINSSFAYWHWRLYDGAINYPLNLLLKLPSIYHLLTSNDIMFFNQMAEKMNKLVDNFVVQKNNIGTQENIKFPQYFRTTINEKILNILNISPSNANLFDVIHSNYAFI